MKETVREEIEAVRRLKTVALKRRYRELFGEDSRSSNQARLFRRVAWRLQALAAEDLSERARERARELAMDADLRLRAPRGFWKELEAATEERKAARDPRLPPAGTELTRKHNGHFIRVRVLEDGFEYKGRRYQSLSAVACQATGTRWNGFLFFGLKKQASHG